MLKEMVCMTVFLFALASVASSVVVVQRMAGRLLDEVGQIMEIANEID